MVETNKRTEADQRPTQPVSAQNKEGSAGSAPSFPPNPNSADGKYERTASGQTKRTSL